MRLTFGRYIPTNSIIHKIDPRFKIALIILLIAAIFFKTGFTGYLVLSVAVFGLFAMSKLPAKMLVKLILPGFFIFLIIFIINLFMTNLTGDMIDLAKQIPGYFESNGDGFSGYIPGDAAIRIADGTNITNVGNKAASIVGLGHFYNWKFLWFSERALYSSFIMGWRIYLMITLTTILTATTQPLEITLGLEDLLYPLRLIGIPVYIFSTIISIALRMIPTLIDEAGRIMKAQASRGIDFKHGGMVEKTKSMSSLIIPLLVSSFQKAEDLAYAMDARGYDPGQKRTRYHQFKFSWFDLTMFLATAILFALVVTYSIVLPATSEFGHIPYIDVLVAY